MHVSEIGDWPSEAKVSERKIVAPEFLVRAVMSQPLVVAACNGKGIDLTEPSAREITRRVCVALTENPIVPTLKQCEAFHASAHPTLTTPTLICRAIAEWQRITFLTPEPEVPEAVKDLLVDLTAEDTIDDHMERSTAHNKSVLEAYRRGVKAGAK